MLPITHEDCCSRGNDSKPKTLFYRTAHLDCFPSNVRRAWLVSCRETWRHYVPHCLQQCYSPHGDGRQEAPLYVPVFPLAWHGLRMGDLGMHGETSALVSSCTVVVMAKHDGVFSYVSHACLLGWTLQKSCQVLRHVSNLSRVVVNFLFCLLPLWFMRMCTYTSPDVGISLTDRCKTLTDVRKGKPTVGSGLGFDELPARLVDVWKGESL